MEERSNLTHFRYSALRKSDAKSGQWVVIGTVYSVRSEKMFD